MMNIVLVGEAWGKEEEAAHEAFVGPSGRFLNAMLHRVGIRRQDCFVTNVFNLRPKPSNNIRNLCGKKAEGIPDMPPIGQGLYVRAEYAPELDRLYEELRRVKPNLIIALGGTPAWAILRQRGIKVLRGTTRASPFGKVLATYHPAAVLRDWSLRPILLADLEKGARESVTPEIHRPHREVWMEPTLADLWEFEERYIRSSPVLSIDIETKPIVSITEIGFAPSLDRSLVVPFYDRLQPDRSYWRTHAEEVKAWKWVKHVCSLGKKIVGQNFLYDIQYIWKAHGIPVPDVTEDTMLLSHALHPEMEKGLGFLGSIYTDEAAWKANYRNETLKQED